MVSPRSWLFCPADRPDRLRKAVDAADAAVADLEDAVHVDGKAAARERLVAVLREDPARACRIWVRVNGDEHLAADLAALAGLPVAGIVVPKAGPELLRAVAERVDVPLLALVETADGLWRVRESAAVPQVRALTLGEYDLADDLGACSPEVDAEPLRWARSRVVAAAAAAGLDPPPAPVSADLTDLDAYATGTARLQRFGFFGRMCIHPKQVVRVHAALRPAADEVDRARKVVLAADAAERDGRAVLVVDGRMIDAPVVRRARRVLDLATADLATGHG